MPLISHDILNEILYFIELNIIEIRSLKILIGSCTDLNVDSGWSPLRHRDHL